MTPSLRTLALAAALTLAVAAPAAAKYPDKPVTVIVPFVAGGSSDITARAVLPGMNKIFGQTFVVENKPGANGSIGAQALARATPDGYTMMVGSIGTFAINQALYKDLSYNPSKDFKYLTMAVRNPNVLVASPNFPAKTVAELIAYAKKNPGSVSYASSGTGSSDHLSAVLFRQKTDTSGIDVPYRGGGAAISDLMGSQVHVSFQNLGAVLQHIKAGKLNALATTGDQRILTFPTCPRWPKPASKTWSCIRGRASPCPRRRRPGSSRSCPDGLRKTLRDPAVTQTLSGLGFDVVANSPEEFTLFQQSEVKRWQDVIAKSNIKLE